MAPWIMTQRWNDLLFLHYAFPPEALRPLVPDELTLDTYQQRMDLGHPTLDQSSPAAGRSVLAVVFASRRSQRAHLRYTRRQEGGLLFSLDASNLFGNMGARVFYRLVFAP